MSETSSSIALNSALLQFLAPLICGTKHTVVLVIIDSNITHRKGSFLSLGFIVAPKLSATPSSIMLPQPRLRRAQVTALCATLTTLDIQRTTSSEHEYEQEQEQEDVLKSLSDPSTLLRMIK